MNRINGLALAILTGMSIGILTTQTAAQDLAGSRISISGDFPATCSPPAASYGMQTEISIGSGNSITFSIAGTPRYAVINGPMVSKPYDIRKHTDFVYQNTVQGTETFRASMQGGNLRLQLARRGEGITWDNHYDIDVSGGVCRFTYSFTYDHPGELQTGRPASQRCTITRANCIMSGPIAQIDQRAAPTPRPPAGNDPSVVSDACGCFTLRQGTRSASQFPFSADNRCNVPVSYTATVCERDYSTGRGELRCEQKAFSAPARSADAIGGYSDGKPAELVRVCASGRCCTPPK